MPPVAVLVFGMHARRIGGIEVHTRELITQLEARNWRTVLCFLEAPCPEVRQYLSSPNVTWEELANVERSWRAGWRLFRLLRRYRPRLIHLQFTPILGPVWIARLSGVGRIVFTDHFSHAEGYAPEKKPAWKRVGGRLLRLPVSFAVSVSEFNREIIVADGALPASRSRRIHNGVDLTRPTHTASGAAFRARYGIPADRILITQISQIIPEKGIDDVLEAARIALAENPDLHFVFVGDGKFLEHYLRRTIEIGLVDRVTWTGLVVDPVAEGVYAASDIVCLASRWQEAFGLVLAEAMSCEKPVVATRVGGIPEVVDDGQTGFLVPPGDAPALAAMFIRLARDEDLRSRLGRSGRARAATHFDVRTNTRSLLELYGTF